MVKLGSSKAAASVLAALALASAAVSMFHPWMVNGGRERLLWHAWGDVLERSLGDLLAFATLPGLLFVAGVALLLMGVAGKARRLRVGGVALLSAAPVYWLAVVHEAGSDAYVALGFWLAVAAAALALAAARVSPGRA